MTTSSARYILIHGAFHDASCWNAVAAELRARGHAAEAVDLPGAGADPTPLDEVTLDLATARVIETIGESGAPVVLVGHSMGGIVITQVAASIPERIARIVYVAAFRPVDGESLLALTQLPEGAGDGVQANISVSGEPPIAVFDAAQADDVFYADVDPEPAAAAREHLQPQPLSLFATPVALPGSFSATTDYVVCTRDRAIPPALQRLMASRTPARVFEFESSHSPFLSRPADLVDLLVS